MKPQPVLQVLNDVHVLLSHRPHALVFVPHEELDDGRELAELSSAQREQVSREPSAPRRLTSLANLVAARRAVAQFARLHEQKELSPTDIDLAHTGDGKPELCGAHIPEGLEISLADYAGFSVALAGPSPVGVDIEAVSCRDCEMWRGLLGMDGYTLALRLQRETRETFDCAATRVWTLLEAGKKAHSLRRVLPGAFRSLGGSWLSFQAKETGQTEECISGLVELGTGGQAVLAAIVGGSEKSSLEKYLALYDISSVDADYSGPQERMVFFRRFPITFRACQTPGKKVHFSNYFGWTGELREYANLPTYSDLKDLFATGNFAIATNFFKLEILDEVSPGEVVEGRLWQDRIYGNDDLGVVLKCDWWKQPIDKDGAGEPIRVAQSEIDYSIVSVLGYGVMRVEPLPRFLRDFVDEMKPKSGAPTGPEEMAGRYKQFDPGEVVWQEQNPLAPAPPLFHHDIQTTTNNANWAGNIYFANYGEWMSHVRDLYFHRLTPDSFKHAGKAGEWLCLKCSVNYLSEAMPFDVVRVEMRVNTIQRRRLELSFDYHLLESGGLARKLAHGSLNMAWVGRDSRNEPQLLDLPQSVISVLLSQIPVAR